MRFEFTSRYVALVRGDVAIGRRPDSTVPLRLNVTDEVPAVQLGPLELWISNCSVQLLSNGAAYQISAMRLLTDVSARAIVAGVARVDVGFHAVVRVEAIGRSGEPVVTRHIVGVALPDLASIEAFGPENTPLCVLLPPGEYTAYLAGASPVQAPFVVREGDQEDMTIRLLA